MSAPRMCATSGTQRTNTAPNHDVAAALDRLARSLPDARAIADELTRRHVKLNLGGSVHDPTDPVGRLLFNVLAMVAEFEAVPHTRADARRHESGQGQGAACAASSPSSARCRKRTSSRSTAPPRTPSASLKSSSR
jgi:Resolvase, N terminal domain